MYGVELYAAVRPAVVEEGVSHHEASRRFGIDRRTVKKMLSYSAPPGYRRLKPVRRPKLPPCWPERPAVAEVPRILLEHHLKKLKLPTVLREYEKLARQCATDPRSTTQLRIQGPGPRREPADGGAVEKAWQA